MPFLPPFPHRDSDHKRIKRSSEFPETDVRTFTNIQMSKRKFTLTLTLIGSAWIVALCLFVHFTKDVSVKDDLHIVSVVSWAVLCR
jgi:hypothetical protein